ERAGQHDSGKAAAAAEVDPDLGAWGKRQQLQRIRNVAGPEGGQRRGGDQSGLGLPFPEGGGVTSKPRPPFSVNGGGCLRPAFVGGRTRRILSPPRLRSLFHVKRPQAVAFEVFRASRRR